jgi:hypothetical protein
MNTIVEQYNANIIKKEIANAINDGIDGGVAMHYQDAINFAIIFALKYNRAHPLSQQQKSGAKLARRILSFAFNRTNNMNIATIVATVSLNTYTKSYGERWELEVLAWEACERLLKKLSIFIQQPEDPKPW